jgi:L-amino acid N-acyltransferase YncA
MAYRVRKAVPADVTALAAFLAPGGLAGRRLDCEVLAATLRNERGCRCWVVESGSVIVATMSVLEEAGPEGTRWFIESIHIDQAHRKRGLTRLLLGAVRHEARRRKVRELTTLCAPQGRRGGDCLFQGRLY